MKYVDEYRDGKLARALAKKIALGGAAGQILSLHGVLRRPHPRHRALWTRRPAARQHQADSWPRLSGVRAADRPHGRRHKTGAAAGDHALHLCRPHARAGLRRLDTDAEARIAGVDPIEIDQALKGRFQRGIVVVTGCIDPPAGPEQGWRHSRHEKIWGAVAENIQARARLTTW